MRLWIQLTIFSVFSLVGAAGGAWAEEPAANSETKSASIEMNAAEIQGDLGEVVNSFKMNQTEIFGDIQSPKMLFRNPWLPPDPFYLETEEGGTARRLIEEAYRPVDRDNLNLQAEMISGSKEAGSSDLASGRPSGLFGLASFSESR